MLVTLDKSNYKTLLFLFLVVLGDSCFNMVCTKSKTGYRRSPLRLKHLKLRKTNHSFTDLEGNAVGLTSYVGEVIVVSSWASWCPSCVDSLKRTFPAVWIIW